MYGRHWQSLLLGPCSCPRQCLMAQQRIYFQNNNTILYAAPSLTFQHACHWIFSLKRYHSTKLLNFLSLYIILISELCCDSLLSVSRRRAPSVINGNSIQERRAAYFTQILIAGSWSCMSQQYLLWTGVKRNKSLKMPNRLLGFLQDKYECYWSLICKLSREISIEICILCLHVP